jgi:triacylglycerol esterase/lipase EstA (alpha/beta hydrolase family)
MVLGVLAGVVLLVLVAGVATVRQSQTEQAVLPVAQGVPGPVLLVPGYGGATSAVEVLAATLRARGRDATVVRLPGRATGDMREQAAVLGDAADAAMERTGAASVDVVGHSAGGVVARLWVGENGGAVARRVVTLGSPHHGTSIAALARDLVPDSCPEACRQLSPDSDLLRGLNAGDETPTGPIFVSIWTRVDRVVTPPQSARLSGAVNVQVQRVCPNSRVEHGDLPRDPRVQAIVLAELGVAAPAVPRTCDRVRPPGS